MSLRRLAVLLAAAVGLLLAGAAPALADPPAYPPGGGGSSGVVLLVAETLVPLHGPLTVTILNCPSATATLTVTGPGRAPGAPTQTFPATTNASGVLGGTVTFDRVGRNTVTSDCGGLAWVTVKAVTPVTVTAASVLGETLQGGGAATVSLATLASTGADAAGPLLIAVLLLLAGFALLLVSRPRRVAEVRSGRHRS